jgi:hypothetical protein
VLVIRAEVSVDVVRATVNVDVTRAGTNVLVVVSVLTRLIIDVDVNDRNTVVAGMVVVLRIVVVTGKGTELVEITVEVLAGSVTKTFDVRVTNAVDVAETVDIDTLVIVVGSETIAVETLVIVAGRVTVKVAVS